MALNDIVNVNISRQTQAVTRVGFGVMMFLGAHRKFSERSRSYTSTTAMTQDGFVASDPELIAATSYFAQSENGSPTKVVIGRRDIDVSYVTFRAMTTTGQIQGVSINGTNFAFTSATGSETAAQVATAVHVLINASSEPVTSVDLAGQAAGTLSLTSDVAEAGDTIVPASNNTSTLLPTIKHTTKQAPLNDVTDIQVQEDTWYGLAFHDHRPTFSRVTFPAINSSAVYGVAVNGTDFEVTDSGSGTSARDAAIQIAASINAGSQPVSAVNNFDGTIDIVDNVSSTSKATVVESSNYSASSSLTIADVNEVLSLATGVEALSKLFGTSTSDVTASNVASASDSTSNPARFENANLARTFSMFDPQADASYPEAAWMGNLFPTDPGSATWKFKTLATITDDNLTETQQTNLRNKSCNFYVEIAGVSITCDGVVAEGEYIDVIRGVDWLKARLQERIYGRLVNLPKIPFTNPGVAIIENEIRGQLDEGIANGFIANDPANHDNQPYTVTVPLVENVSSNSKANRSLPDVKFRATLAGAIHDIDIDGIVTV